MKKVLVIDDDHNMNDFTTRMLRTKHNCEVTSTFNAIDGFYYLRNQGFDLLVLDISMPVLSGIEVLRLIREDDELKNLPVVMMTAIRDKEIITEIINLGILDYIAKPLTVEGTNKKLSETLLKVDSIKNKTIFTKKKINNNIIIVAEATDKIRKEFNLEEYKDYKLCFTSDGIEILKFFIKHNPGYIYLGKDINGLNRAFIIKAIKKIDNNCGVKIIMNGKEADFAEELKADIDFFCDDSVEELKKIIKI